MLRLVQSREELEADETRIATVIIQMQSSNNNGFAAGSGLDTMRTVWTILGNVNRISLPMICGDQVKNGVKEEFKCLD